MVLSSEVLFLVFWFFGFLVFWGVKKAMKLSCQQNGVKNSN